MSRFMYLVAIMGWHNRKFLAWLLSNTPDTDFVSRPSQKPSAALKRLKSSIPIRMPFHRRCIYRPAEQS
jgi:hypothetical protein